MKRRMRNLLMLVGLFVAACGGSDEGGLFGSSGSGGGTATGGAAGVDAGGSAGASGASTGGTSGMAGDSGGGSAGSAGSSGGGGGVDPTDAGSGGVNATGIGPCGEHLCSFALGALCCDSSTKGLYCSNDKLGNPCTCSGIGCNTLRIACDGEEDCDGAKKCCAVRNIIGPDYDRVECRTSCTGITLNAAEVCHPGGTPCPSGQACKPDSRLPPGYFTCQAN